MRVRIKFGTGPRPARDRITLTLSPPCPLARGDVVEVGGREYVVARVVDETRLELRRLWPHDRLWLLAKWLWKKLRGTFPAIFRKFRGMM